MGNSASALIHKESYKSSFREPAPSPQRSTTLFDTQQRILGDKTALSKLCISRRNHIPSRSDPAIASATG